ncbi:helix-turn-helix domain-containing protein [Streptosporangiaceae bacterium NEAU-GS5]|nr:helix-turn-helix domain-containing protein [Streptosporangiaceae bacterium NEAU-GS5]
MSNASTEEAVAERDLIKLDEVAKMFGCSKRTVQELVTARRLRSYLIHPRCRRVDRKDALAYLESVSTV